MPCVRWSLWSEREKRENAEKAPPPPRPGHFSQLCVSPEHNALAALGALLPSNPPGPWEFPAAFGRQEDWGREDGAGSAGWVTSPPRAQALLFPVAP